MEAQQKFMKYLLLNNFFYTFYIFWDVRLYDRKEQQTK